jgi:hypothetical protein
MLNGVYTFDVGTNLAETSGDTSVWQVSAMTAGKFGSDTTDKLIVAAVVNGTQYVFRGDGKSAINGSAMPGADNGSPLYASANWRIPALTNGPITGSTNQLIAGFTYVGSGSPLNRIYYGDGVSGVATNKIFDDPNKVITRLAFGSFGGTQRLITGVISGGVSTVYESQSLATNLLYRAIYQNQYWDITSLAAGHIDNTAGSDVQLLTAFDLPNKTEVHWGDGNTTSLGATNRGVYYANP